MATAKSIAIVTGAGQGASGPLGTTVMPLALEAFPWRVT